MPGSSHGGRGESPDRRWTGTTPAELPLLCGIFGNVSDEDVRRPVAAVPALLATGGTAIWTRNTCEPDLTPRARAWFAEVGVVETVSVAAPPPGWSVCAGVSQASSQPLGDGRRLFTFVR
jgi:hypothetical protein